MKQKLILAALVLALALPSAVPVLAQEMEDSPTAYIWVSFLTAQPEKSEDLIKILKEQDGPLFDQLVADGKALEWGIAQPIVHDSNVSFSVGEWVTFAGWQGVQDFINGFMAKQMAMSEEDRAAAAKAYMSAVVPGSHSDAVYEAVHANTSGTAPGYLRIGYHKALPGKGSQVQKTWESFAQPVYQQLLDDGKIGGYGLFVPEIHGDHSWSHGSWVTIAGLDGLDAVNGAFDAAQEARSEEERMKLQQSFQENFTPDAHYDHLLLIRHYHNGSQ